jgi:hypothetical protein
LGGLEKEERKTSIKKTAFGIAPEDQQQALPVASC